MKLRYVALAALTSTLAAVAGMMAFWHVTRRFEGELDG